MRISLVIGLLGLLAACASQPASRPAPAQAAKTAAVTAGQELSPDERFAKLAASYRKVEKEEQTLYCRKELPLGTRLPVEQCYTEADLREQARSAEALRDHMRIPSGSPCDQLMGCGG